MKTNHIAAIHVLKSKLGLPEEDYRALLKSLTRSAAQPDGKSSTKNMSERERQQVRDHMQREAERAGVAHPSASGWQAKRAASPQERKVWAIWNALRRSGHIKDNSKKALNAWVKRTVQVDALEFCTGPQLDTLIEALKRWQDRPVREVTP